MIRSIALALVLGALCTVSAARAHVIFCVEFYPEDSTFELYAAAEPHGNAGIAAFVVNWAPAVRSATNEAPFGISSTVGQTMGFTVERTSFPQLFAGQSTNPASIIYRMGQQPGEIPGVLTILPHSQPQWRTAVLLATGTYTGLPFWIDDIITSAAANVWDEVGSNTARAATVQVMTPTLAGPPCACIPEPAALGVLVLALVVITARFRAANVARVSSACSRSAHMA